jgi:hypothetical protein
MVEIGGGGQAAQHEDPFKEAGSKSAQRGASLGQLAFLMSYLRPHHVEDSGNNRADLKAEELRRLTRQEAAFEQFRHDAPYVERFLWGGRDADGRWQPGQPLDGAYQAWLGAAGKVETDPLGARAVMEMCRRRMAACPGGPDLLRAYKEHLYNGKDNVQAMRRAWADTTPAREAGSRGRTHEAAPERGQLNAPNPKDARLPVAAHRSGQPGAGRGPARPTPVTAAAEAVRLLGAPDVTMPQVGDFQHRYGNAADRDGAVLARQWLADVQRHGLITQEEHDAWRDKVAEMRRSPGHAQWRIEHGLDPVPTPQPSAPDGATQQAAQTTDEAGTIKAATTDHLSGHAAQHHHTSGRKLGQAVDDALTPDVDEQALYRQRAYTERGVAEIYDAQAAQSKVHGLRARAAAARPSPAALRGAARPPNLAGKRPAPVMAMRPSPVVPPPGRT